MRAGLPFTAELIYPVYVDNHIVLPENTLLNGTVVALRPDRSRRIRATLGGDLTPFHIPVVHFNELVLPDGVHVPIETGNATDGAPIFRAVSPPKVKGGFVRQEFEMGLTVVSERRRPLHRAGQSATAPPSSSTTASPTTPSGSRRLPPGRPSPSQPSPFRRSPRPRP